MENKRAPFMIGAGVFFLSLAVGWIVTRAYHSEIGFAEISGIFHAAMGIGFSTGFLSYVVLRARSSKKGS